MTLLLKDPEAELDYAVDWGADYLGGDSLAQSDWEVAPAETGGVAIVDATFDALIATVKAGGGIPGRLYRLTNRVVMASGLIDSRSITLRVEPR
ncbi:MAG: hypothetical protein H0V46_04660 [Sphingomonas sp.]|nr:hypothetical protein [Sphingomonas sp.]